MPFTYDPVTAASLNPGGVSVPALSASTETVHQMFVAVAILLLIGMLLVIVAGIGDSEGNAVLGLLSILLVVQAVTHVSPFVAWLANHPLTPAQSVSA